MNHITRNAATRAAEITRALLEHEAAARTEQLAVDVAGPVSNSNPQLSKKESK
jgi:hypothetical protein